MLILALGGSLANQEKRVFSVDAGTDLSDKVFSMAGELLSPGYRIYRLGARGIVNEIVHILDKHSIDIIEMEESFGWHYHVQKQINVPIVMRLHGPHYVNGLMTGNPPTRLDKLRIKREKRAFLAAKYVSAPSEWVLNSVQQTTQANWPICRTIANPAPEVDESACWKFEHMISGQILFVGRFDRHKGGDIVLKAVAELFRTRPELSLVFAGPDHGVFEAGKQYTLPTYAAKLFSESQMKQVRYLGPVDKPTIDRLRAESHITVIASRKENFPYTALEALAFGTAVVASRVGGITEIFEERQSGLYFEPENEVDLSDKIMELLDHPELLFELSDGAKKRARDRFSKHRLAIDTIDFYESVLREESKQTSVHSSLSEK